MLKNRLLFILLIFLFSFQSLAQESDWQLSETLLITGSSTQFSIAYPAGWQASVQRGSAIISEEGQDQARASGEAFAVAGYLIRFERIPVRSLREMGITQESSLTEALDLLAVAEGYTEGGDISETTLLTWPALRLQTTDSMGNSIITIVAQQGLELIRLSLAAPSAEALETFLPTWEAMLVSIKMQQGIVNMGGFNLNFECQGEGSPTVILESGWGADYSYWSSVMQNVSEITRVCAVSRRVELGIGAAQQHVDELHQFLGLVGIEAPYVLVGHSYGGLTSRIFADEYPDEVVGMVLVDSAVEGQVERFIEVMDNETITDYMAIPVDESAAFPYFETSSERAAEIESLGDIPLIVLTAEHFADVSSDPIAIEIETTLRPVWINELQAGLVSLSTQGTQIVVPNTTHGSIVFNPATAEAIRELVETLRAENPQ
jgi:hypothetical protein